MKTRAMKRPDGQRDRERKEKGMAGPCVFFPLHSADSDQRPTLDRPACRPSVRRRTHYIHTCVYLDDSSCIKKGNKKPVDRQTDRQTCELNLLLGTRDTCSLLQTRTSVSHTFIPHTVPLPHQHGSKTASIFVSRGTPAPSRTASNALLYVALCSVIVGRCIIRRL